MRSVVGVLGKVLRASLFFIGAIAFFITIRATAHASLIPVNLTPTTTLTAETSNNTSAANDFPGWLDGDEAPGNVSKVNIHTLLYPGNTTKIFAFLEPWFCVNAPGEISDSNSNQCGGHLQVGYAENTIAQVDAMVNDMMSRGIDGVVCDFYGTGYDTDTDAQRGVCDKAAVAAAAALSTGGTFSFMEQVDDGSWKWRCDPTANPTGWSALGYGSLGACIEAIMKQDLTYFNANYYGNPAYYSINGRPVVSFFVDETGPMENLGSSGWATLWSDMRAWAPANGNPLFIFESAANSGNEFWSYSDGAYGWPQPPGATAEDWQTNGYLPWYYNTLKNDNLAVEQGSTYKGFNDTLASWGENRIIDQQCGQAWLDTWNEPAINNDFGIQRQLQGMLIATWNDYEEGTEIETGIDNCLSISASSASTSTLNWNVSGQVNTLDHYTAYISTDGQNLAILQDNISPASTSLNLAQYNIPTGTYTLYVKAVGKPSIINHMSNAVALTVSATSPTPTSTPAGGSCGVPVFNGGAVSVTTTTPGGAYTMTCDFGFNGSGVTVTAGSGQCTYSKFNGTQAIFNCTAGMATGTFQNFCRVGNWNTLNYCTASDTVASLTVVSPFSIATPISTSTCASDCGTTPPPTVSQSGNSSSGGGGGGDGGGGSSGGGSGGNFSSGGGTSGDYAPTPEATTSTEALLQSLLQELEGLERQLNIQIVASFSRNLTIGMTGSDVKNLQLFLNNNGYPIARSGPGSPGDESSYFGRETAVALAKFQAAHGLPATGYFGSLTRALLGKEFQ